nr:MAG TPA: hypothetical protein [Caudoviricetes sp.]
MRGLLPLLSKGQFTLPLPGNVRCAKRAVPDRVPDRNDREPASHAVKATDIEGAEAPPSTDTRRGRIAAEAGLAADSTAGRIDGSGPLNVSAGGILDILPTPRGIIFRKRQRQAFLLDIILGDGSAADLALVLADIAIKGEVLIGILAPLPQLVADDEVGAVHELDLLEQTGFLAVGGIVLAAVSALNVVVPTGEVRHSAQEGLVFHGIKRVGDIDVHSGILAVGDSHRLNGGNADLGGNIVNIGHVAVSRAIGISADRHRAANKQVCGLFGGQNKAFCAGLGNGCLVLVVVAGAALDSPAVALTRVLQAHHAVEELHQRARTAGILCAASAPQSYARGVAGVVDGSEAGAAGGLTTNLAGVILRVGDIGVDMAGAVLALAPLLEAGGLAALHLEVLVAVSPPFTDKGVLLQHPAQMLARTNIIEIVDVLDVEDFVAAIFLFLGSYLNTPELGQVCEVVAARSGCGRRSADEANAVIGQLADSTGAGGIQRNGASVNTVIVQHVAKPAFEHLNLAVLAGIVLSLPPFDEQAVHLILGGSMSDEVLIAQVSRAGGGTAGSDSPLDFVGVFQRGVAGEIDYLICHRLVLLDDKIQAAIRFIECGLYLTGFDSDDAPVVFCRVCHQLLGSRVDVVGMVGVGRLGNLDGLRIGRRLGVNGVFLHPVLLPAGLEHVVQSVGHLDVIVLALGGKGLDADEVVACVIQADLADALTCQLALGQGTFVADGGVGQNAVTVNFLAVHLSGQGGLVVSRRDDLAFAVHAAGTKSHTDDFGQGDDARSRLYELLSGGLGDDDIFRHLDSLLVILRIKNPCAVQPERAVQVRKVLSGDEGDILHFLGNTRGRRCHRSGYRPRLPGLIKQLAAVQFGRAIQLQRGPEVDFSVILNSATGIVLRKLRFQRNAEPSDDGFVLRKELPEPVLDGCRPVLPRPVERFGPIQKDGAVKPQSWPEIHGHFLPRFQPGILLGHAVLEPNPHSVQVDALRGVELTLPVHQAKNQVVLAHGIQQHGAVEVSAAIKQSRPPERNGGFDVDIPQEHLFKRGAVENSVHAVDDRVGRVRLLGGIQQPLHSLGVQRAIAYEHSDERVRMADLIAILAAIVDVCDVRPEAGDVRQHGLHAVRSHRCTLVALLVDELPALVIGEVVAHRQPPLEFMVHQAPCGGFREELERKLFCNKPLGLVKFKAHDLIQPLANIGLVVESGGDRGKHILCALAGGKVFKVNFLSPHSMIPPS